MKYKKSIALIALCAVMISKPLKLAAQKGSWLAEGNIGNLNISNNKQDESAANTSYKINLNSIYFSLYPRIGYFISNRFVLGATLNFDYRRDKYSGYSDHNMKSSDNLDKSAIISLVPFARYYFSTASKNRFYAQLGAGAGTSLFYNYAYTDYYNTGAISGTGKTNVRQNLFTGEAMVGFSHFFTYHIAFNTAIGYAYVQQIRHTTQDFIYNGVINPTNKDKVVNKIEKLVWTFGFTMIIPSKKNR